MGYISPVYILLPLAFIVIIGINADSLYFVKSPFVLIVWMYFILQYVFVGANATIVNLTIGLIGYYLIKGVYGKLNIDVYDYFIKGSRVILPLFVAEAVVRILNPKAPTDMMTATLESSDMSYYLYKFNSFMFRDSNTTALFLMCFLFTFLALKPSLRLAKNEFYIVSLLFALICITFSRSAIITTIFFLIIIFLWQKSKLYPLLFVFFAFIIVFLNQSFFLEDVSFQTKTSLLIYLYQYLYEASLFNIIFGHGIGSANLLLGYSPHILIFQLILDIGIVGILIFFLFVFRSIRGSDGRSLYVILPLLIASFSYFLYLGFPFLFICLALVEVNRKSANVCSFYR